MSINFRNYTEQPGITNDYYLVRDFLLHLGYCEYTYARFDWMITHPNLEQAALRNIGLWEENEKLVGLAIFDTVPGNAFCLTKPNYQFLKSEMVPYAKENLSKDGQFSIVISDTDIEYQMIANNLGYIGSHEKEYDAVFYCDTTSMDYQLPEGFHVTSMKDTYDPYQYGKVLWKGFNHELNGEGEYQFTSDTKQSITDSMIRANVDLNLKIAVVTPDGDFAAFCGMWYEPIGGFAVIEPVATDPAYRNMGLGKAAVLEGIKRVHELGARNAFVGSSQQFYYSIGMKPYSSATYWKLK